MERWLNRVAVVFILLVGAVACAENPVTPGPGPAPTPCADCYVIYITVYDALDHTPIKATVSVDGYERHTDDDGAVSILVTNSTVMHAVTISAVGYVAVTRYPTPGAKPANIFVELLRA